MKLSPLALLPLALALAACAKSDKASDAASSDNVEMPAEEALSGVEGTASADPMATVTEASTDASSEAGSAASEAATASAAGSAASTAANKRM
jgi:hypothetical protein